MPFEYISTSETINDSGSFGDATSFILIIQEKLDERERITEVIRRGASDGNPPPRPDYVENCPQVVSLYRDMIAWAAQAKPGDYFYGSYGDTERVFCVAELKPRRDY